MIMLPNVRFDVMRSPYNNGATDTVQPLSKDITGHLTRIKDSQLVVHPAMMGALQAIYEIYTETTEDIRKGDIIVNVIRLDTNEPWLQANDEETWRVLDANNSSPGSLEYRDIVIGRLVGGGVYQ